MPKHPFQSSDFDVMVENLILPKVPVSPIFSERNLLNVIFSPRVFPFRKNRYNVQHPFAPACLLATAWGATGGRHGLPLTASDRCFTNVNTHETVLLPSFLLFYGLRFMVV